MKILKFFVLIISVCSFGWSDESEEVLKNCFRLEEGFLGLKEIVIQVFDRNEDKEIENRVLQEVISVFDQLGGREHSINYMSDPGQLQVILTRKNDRCFVSLILLSMIESDPGLLFIDCFSVAQQDLLPKISTKIGKMMGDLASGGSFPTVYYGVKL